VSFVAETAARRANRRGEGARLRADILAAAASLIEQTGSEQAVTLREVARRIGIAAPSIYEHFPNREAVVDAVVDDGFTQLRAAVGQAMDSQPDPLARLRAGCTAYLDFARQHPGQYRVLFGRRRHLRGGPPGPAAAGAETFNLLVTALRDCADAGRCASDDPYGDAITIWIALHGYATLHPSLPAFTWPAPQAVMDRILSRYAPAARSHRAGPAGGPGEGETVPRGRLNA